MPRARPAVPEDRKPGLDLKASRFLSFFSAFVLFLYLLLATPGGARRGLSLIAASEGYSPAAVCGWRLWSWSSGSRAQGLQQSRHVGSLAAAPGLERSGPVAVAQGLSCSPTRGLFLEQGLNLRLLHWEADSLLLSHQGSPRGFL